MKCPKCGAIGSPTRRCVACGGVFSTDDLTKLSQLEFLLKETANWEVAETLRVPYLRERDVLKDRLVPRKTIQEVILPPRAELVSEIEEVPAPQPELPTAKPAPRPKPVKPPKEKVPFDQWLLSERNIKFALYSGALLLVVAGLIFVGVSWGRMPGPLKFAITLMITGLMYLGGYLLFRRPSFQIGGIALLGVASGFVIVNFAVLQVHVLGPAGLRNEVMWLIASPLCLLLYLMTAYWTRADLLTYLSIGALVSTVTAAVTVAGAHASLATLAFALLGFGLVWLARAVIGRFLADFTLLPLLVVTQLGMPLLVFYAIFGLPDDIDFCTICGRESYWLRILALSVIVLFYFSTDNLFKRLKLASSISLHRLVDRVYVKWLAARWVAVALMTMTFAFMLEELGANDTLLGLGLMLLALAYLGVGYAMERREKLRAGALPFFVIAYAIAALVTLRASLEVDSLYKVLLGDVALTALSAAVFRNYRWVYGAAWLFMLPVYLFLTQYVSNPVYQGLFLGLLGLNYALAGYALGRRKLSLGGPFLSAAVFLSIIVLRMTVYDPAVASLVLGVEVVLYLGAALWLGRNWLLLAPLVALHLLMLTLLALLNVNVQVLASVLTVSYGLLGLVLLLGGYALHHTGQTRWGLPLYLVAIIDLVGAYLSGITLGGALAVGVSVVMAVLLFTFTWLERERLAKRKPSSLLTYAGILVVFFGLFFALDMLGLDAATAWSPFMAGLCALFYILSWLMPRQPLATLYGIPARNAGLVTMVLPVIGAIIFAIFNKDPIMAVITMIIAGLVFAADGVKRQSLPQVWALIAIIFIGHFFVLNAAGIDPEGIWPPITAGLCAGFVALSWFVHRYPLLNIYLEPLRRAGLLLMFIPVIGAVGLAIANQGPLMAVITLSLAAVIFATEALKHQSLPMVWAAIAVVFVGHFFVLDAVGFDPEGGWPPITAGLCAAFVALSWLLRRYKLVGIFSTPLHLTGLMLMIIPLSGVMGLMLANNAAGLFITTFAIGGLTYGIDGKMRRIVWQVYLGFAALVMMIWVLLSDLNVSEPQAYVIPSGLLLLGIGWNERRYGRRLQYQGSILPGMVVLMGSAFLQSLEPGNWPYALLLVAESLIFVGLGVRWHLKRCVQVGGVALLVNAIAQLGPAFLELSGWIQIALVGTILLGGGMLALFKREKILSTRQKLGAEWRQWGP